MARQVKVITAAEAAALIKNGDTVTTSGFVASAIPEALDRAVEERFLATGEPRDITYVYCGSQGNKDGRGAEHFAHEGLLKRYIAGHWATVPALQKMALENKMEAYNVSQGALCHLFRDIAAHRPGCFTKVGLGTFIDPRNGGGKVNDVTKEDIIELVNIKGQDYLFYPAFPINVALIRGTYADESGNISFEKEVSPLEGTSVCQAVKNSGGIVVVQVEKLVKAGTLDPRLVKVPGIYVDYVVVADPKDHQQTLDCDYDPALSGEMRNPDVAPEPLPLSAKKIIGRRGAVELEKDVAVNLGVGAPEYVASVANEEGIGDFMTLLVVYPQAASDSVLLTTQTHCWIRAISSTSMMAAVWICAIWVWLNVTLTAPSTFPDLAPELPAVVVSSTLHSAHLRYSSAVHLQQAV